MSAKRSAMLGMAGALCALLHWTALADPLSTWHQRNSLSQTNPLNSIAYGKGLFVTVGEGTILSSPDGIEWTRRDSRTNAGLGLVVYGNGTFLGSNPYELSRSNDGTNWASSTWIADEPIEGLDFANDRFFVLSHDLRENGDRALIFTSTDTTNWTRFNTGRSGAASAVSYATGLYVAVGAGFATGHPSYIPLVLLSSDAVIWKKAYDFDSPLYWDVPFADVTFGNGLFAAVFTSIGSGGIMTSSDGVNWTLRLAEPPLRTIAFGDGVFVAVGSLGSLVTSTDGINWTKRDLGTKYWLGGVAYGQNTFVVVGNNGLIFQSDPIVTLGMTRVTNGKLSLTGPPGRTCEIQAVDDLLATNNWQSLGTFTLTNSPVSWTDPALTNRPQRFYRAVLQQ